MMTAEILRWCFRFKSAWFLVISWIMLHIIQSFWIKMYVACHTFMRKLNENRNLGSRSIQTVCISVYQVLRMRGQRMYTFTWRWWPNPMLPTIQPNKMVPNSRPKRKTPNSKERKDKCIIPKPQVDFLSLSKKIKSKFKSYWHWITRLSATLSTWLLRYNIYCHFVTMHLEAPSIFEFTIFIGTFLVLIKLCNVNC